MGDGLTYPLKVAKSKKPVQGISLPSRVAAFPQISSSIASFAVCA
jgi:hypothetical protein